jgi:beta-fructofuranosidase
MRIDMAQTSDHLRPLYHFLPPSNWLNDPNGLIQWRGRYHLFYQYNPNGPFHGTIHWGHAASDDLVHWENLPIALAPTPGGPDKDGVYSGCAVDHDGVPTLVYTGIHPEVQCLATPADANLTTWRKHPANPVIAAPPAGLEVEGFRDPYVWQEADGWYCAIGSGLKDVGGCVLLYRSADLVHWEYLHELCRGEITEAGRIWECPNFFPLGTKHVLLVSPIPLRKVLYLIGDYRDHRFAPERVAVVDDGGCYYAPQVMRDERGRRLMWGWLREERDQEAQRAAGWSGVMSLPTEVSLAPDGRLMVTPVPEVAALRAAHCAERAIALSQTEPFMPAGVEGARLEIMAVLEPGGAVAVGLSVLRSPDGQEETRITFDRSAGQLTVDRQQSSLDAGTVRDTRAVQVRPAADGTLSLRVFVDGSVVETFASDGTSISSRVYPTRVDSRGVRFFAQGGSALLRSLDVWEMASRAP